MRRNLERLGLKAGFEIQSGSVAAYLRRVRPSAALRFDLVFLDPPYDATDEYATVLGLLGGSAMGLMAESAMVIAEHRRKERLEDRYRGLARSRLLEQGDAALSFYKAQAPAATE